MRSAIVFSPLYFNGFPSRTPNLNETTKFAKSLAMRLSALPSGLLGRYLMLLSANMYRLSCFNLGNFASSGDVE